MDRSAARSILTALGGGFGHVHFQADAPSSFRQLPIPGCVSPAIFSPTAFDSSNDFLSVAVATFLQAMFGSRANFFAVCQVSGGRDGCRQAGARAARPGAQAGSAASVTAQTPARTQDAVIFDEPGRRARVARGDGGDSCAGGSAERIPAHEAALHITALVSGAGKHPA
jgi:hypothetical protein